MAATFPKRSLHRHWPTLLGGALAAILLLAAWNVHVARQHLVSISNAQLLEASEAEARAIRQAHARLFADARQLAATAEVTGFFANLDLGMSRLYGLNANLAFIAERFAQFAGEREPAYRRIALVDVTGEVLVTHDQAADGLPAPDPGAPEGSRIDLARGMIETTAFARARGIPRGRLVTQVDMSALTQPIRKPQAGTGARSYLVLGDGALVLDPAGMAVEDSPYSALLPDRLPGEAAMVRAAATGERIDNRIAIRVAVPEIGATLLTLRPVSDLPDAMRPNNNVAFLVALSGLVLAGAFVISRLDRRTRRLRTVYEMSRKHSAQLRRKNAELSREVARRQVIERDLKLKSHQLDRSMEDLRIAATAFESQEGMVVLDESGQIMRVNSALATHSGFLPWSLLGRALADLVEQEGDAPESLGAALRNSHSWQGDVLVHCESGETESRWLTLSPVRDSAGRTTNFVGTFYDVSKRRHAENQIRQLAFYDQLTGLPNRPLLMDRAKQAMRANRDRGGFGALLFIDLDHFKTLNDTLGHDFGDKLLQEAAGRIGRCVGPDDTVARFGGDEFVVLLPNLCTADERQAVFSAEEVGDRILDAIARPFMLDGYEHACSASVGIALFSASVETFDEILKRADIAMYDAKAAGRNAVRFFDPEMQRVVAEEASLEADLREAVEGNGFELFFQPQIGTDGRIVGAEALLRWPHPERGMVRPDDFVPIAEKTGLILQIGEWVFSRVLERLALWATQDAFSQLVVSVNVSPVQLRNPEFVTALLGAIDRTGARPERLKLEITESLLIRNMEEAIGKMTLLRQRGILFSLDDFGTGYSSLSYLRQMPLDQLKIDRSFVRDLPENPNDAAIAEMVVALGNTLGLSVIAEGVETAAQRDFLEEIGCDQFQGFRFGHPMPLDRFEDFVLEQAGNRARQASTA